MAVDNTYTLWMDVYTQFVCGSLIDNIINRSRVNGAQTQYNILDSSNYYHKFCKNKVLSYLEPLAT